ncbi:EAL domain-containing protein [Alteromonas sp. KUL49]|uniref:bifunctional diguanylate cyclase/phosphodiesterase n=1 Tax=Alteromonas sp. KUL49 TaxID=2480798 RepID=UPI00102EFFE7|nr:EAL domain-containing protein [Alteromonas sp. KUL49]TAP40330.1 EAL domain-containing protein [Alteromonas sp. KUL49]GEA11475.1 GGDEF domain-containing protein [Alteromonas sp. KUL49]
MSLTKQFSLGFMVVLILVFFGTVWINVNSFRVYINDQLSSHAQDTATSLGLSISPYVGDESMSSIVETMINAIFDSGYYESIELSDLDNKIIYAKENPPAPESVPEWFMDMFPLNPPVATTEINSGWNIAGNMEVKSHPGIGYNQLWENAQSTFRFTLLLFIVGTTLLYAVLRMIITPIFAVVRASERISARDFSEITDIPKTKELSLMVRAINKMAAILNKQHKELTAQAQSYYQTAYLDPLTQLGNKLALDNRLARLFADKENTPSGFLLIVRLSSLAHVNESEGGQTADIYIKTLSHILTQQSAKVDAETFRVRGGDFVVVIENISEDNCGKFLNTLSNEFVAQTLPIYTNGFAHIGAARFTELTGKAKLLENADAALTTAKNQPNRWQLASQMEVQMSQSAWRKEFSRIIEQKAVEIFRQPVKDFDGRILYHECYARFKAENGKDYLPMSQLIAESEHLHCSGELDLVILEKILTLFSKNGGEPVAINLSSASLGEKSTIDQLLTLLKKYRNVASNLIVEIPEICLQKAPKNIHYLTDVIREIGVKVTIERLGSSISAFSHLRKLRPDFVKLDGSYTRNIHLSEDNQFFVRSLVNIAHGLNVSVIAELVEEEIEAQTLQELFVDYVQGYLYSQPNSWT